MKYICNPLNVNYRYQFCTHPMFKGIDIAREAADPSLIYFKNKYYIFASMTLGVWVSNDLVTWENHKLPKNLPLYDYAPDVRVMGDYVYFCASKRDEICNYYRTKNILEGPYEEIPGTFDFWDPNLFLDDDGKIYFYWGCDSKTPIYGVELDKETMRPISEKTPLIWGNPFDLGYERRGKNYDLEPEKPDKNYPYVEGAWMNKFNNKYYLQYACPGAEFDTYADGVYISEHPLGPYTLAKNNPYSYKPSGFINGAGHGSTAEDAYGNLWHTSTMCISVNFIFERRVGLWPAGIDADGELFCNQRYGDWPMKVENKKMDPWEEPEWYLLNYNKPAFASSCMPNHEPNNAVNENIRTCWRPDSAHAGEWIVTDLEQLHDVHAIQINFSDDHPDIPVPGKFHGEFQKRYIDDYPMYTRWILEGSEDGEVYFMIKDKSNATTDLSHDMVVLENGIKARFIKLTILEVPYGQIPCISGLRVFGNGFGDKPEAPEFTVRRIDALDMQVHINAIKNAIGYNILWGHTPDKLYHSYLTYTLENRIGALIKDQNYYIRIDAFNENGITHGQVFEVI